MLLELQRLCLVAIEGYSVRLLREALVPNASVQESRSLLAGAVSDHLHAGVHNLNPDGQGKFLEQSVFADGLQITAWGDASFVGGTFSPSHIPVDRNQDRESGA